MKVPFLVEKVLVQSPDVPGVSSSKEVHYLKAKLVVRIYSGENDLKDKIERRLRETIQETLRPLKVISFRWNKLDRNLGI